MSKIFKIILLGFILILVSGFLATPFAKAVSVQRLLVEWSKNGNTWFPLNGPIFGEANFLPGESVVRFIRVTNNSISSQRIGIEAINKNDPDNFASQLDFAIAQGGTTIFNKTLADFFNQGETYLSDLASGVTTQYDLTVLFEGASGNSYQGKNLDFDILVGFEGTDGGLTLPQPGDSAGGGGGGGGGGLPPGLTIVNEAVASSTDTSATITWFTSYPATSQVLYAQEGEAHILNLIDDVGAPPHYGYAHTTLESNNPANVNGVLSHSVTIYGLLPGVKYYYRAVSHGSLAISQEHSFNTLSKNSKVAEIMGDTSRMSNEIFGGVGNGNINRSKNGAEDVSIQNPIAAGNNAVNVDNSSTDPIKTILPETISHNLLASIIGIFPFDRKTILISVLIALVLIIGWLVRKKRGN